MRSSEVIRGHSGSFKAKKSIFKCVQYRSKLTEKLLDKRAEWPQVTSNDLI